MFIHLEQLNKDSPSVVKRKFIQHPRLLIGFLVNLEENFNVLEWRVVGDNCLPLPQGSKGQWLKQVTEFSLY